MEVQLINKKPFTFRVKNMKYSFEKIEDRKSYVWHTEGDNKTLIAITDDIEKAHFLATAANAYKEPASPCTEMGQQGVDRGNLILLLQYIQENNWHWEEDALLGDIWYQENESGKSEVLNSGMLVDKFLATQPKTPEWQDELKKILDSMMLKGGNTDSEKLLWLTKELKSLLKQ